MGHHQLRQSLPVPYSDYKVETMKPAAARTAGTLPQIGTNPGRQQLMLKSL